MAQGDITKEIEYDKIEVVMQWNIQVRKATKIMEELEDGSKRELSRSFHRHVLVPFYSVKGEDGKWTHTPTDLSSENAKVKAIAETAWDNDTKTAYKTFRRKSEYMSDNVININGKDHNIDTMSDQQKYLIKQIRSLTAEEERLSFQLDPIRVAKNAFTNSLIQSLEEKDEFKTRKVQLINVG